MVGTLAIPVIGRGATLATGGLTIGAQVDADLNIYASGGVLTLPTTDLAATVVGLNESFYYIGPDGLLAFAGMTVTGASYAATSTGHGILTLTGANGTLDQFPFDGDFSGKSFFALPRVTNNLGGTTTYVGPAANVVGNVSTTTADIHASIAIGGTYTADYLLLDPFMPFETPIVVQVQPGATLAVGDARIRGGGVVVTGAASRFTASGTVSVGGVAHVVPVLASLVLRAGASGQSAGDVLLATQRTLFSIDASSSFEIGLDGNPAVGALTVDPSRTLSGAGSVDATVVNNGHVVALGFAFYGPGLTLNGPVSGTGTLEIDDLLVLRGPVAASQTVLFGSNSGTLDISGIGGLVVPVGNVVPGDSFILPTSVATASYSAGNVALLNEVGGLAGTLQVAGSLDGNSFLLIPGHAGVAPSLLLAAGTMQAGTPPAPVAGTALARSLTWATAIGGDWSTAAHWTDTATSAAPIVAPGSLDSVAILGAVTPAVVSGAGNAGTLTLGGNLVLSGSFNTNSLVVSPSSIAAASVMIAPYATLTALQAPSIGGELMVAGHYAGLFIASATLASQGRLDAYGGSVIGISTLTSNPLKTSLAVDVISVIEIGGGGHAAIGRLVVDPGVTVSGIGTIEGDVGNLGTMTAIGTIMGNVSGNGHLVIGGLGTLAVAGQIGPGQTVDFGGYASLTLDVGSDPDLITAFDFSDTINLRGVSFDSAGWTQTAPGFGSLALTAAGVTVQTLKLSGNFLPTDFLLKLDHFAGIDIVVSPAPVACFAAGTTIATTRGNVAVEALAVDDRVLLASGGIAPVQWLGHRRIDLRRHPRPQDVQPIRVRAHAFGGGLPTRDLLLSPDHAVFVDGVLIPIRYLLNGRSIVQLRMPAITYFHVELPAHAVLLAEGLPCESYLDTGNRTAFANGGDALQLHPVFAPGNDRAWTTAACAELVLEGAKIANAKENLLALACTAGDHITLDPNLVVLADGQPLPASIDGTSWTINIPPRARRLRLHSRSWVPAHMRGAETDTRQLGVALANLRMNKRPMLLDDARLSSGWHPAEADWRWTDGDAGIALAGAGAFSFDIEMAGSYWAGRDSRQRRATESAIGSASTMMLQG